MKRTLLILGMCFFVLTLIAQEQKNLLADQRVEPPKFKGTKSEQIQIEAQKSPICCYIEKELEYPDFKNNQPPEGIVGIVFTINADGSVSDFVVSNAVNYDLEQAVINCIKETNGLWEPGKVNGFSSPMEKSIYVKFDVLGNAPFEEISASYYMTALKKYYQGQNIRNDHLLSMEKKEKKSERRFNSSLNCLKKATKFSPNDPTILHWQARNYEMLARYNEMRESLEQRQKLLSQSVINNQMIGNIELAIITK